MHAEGIFCSFCHVHYFKTFVDGPRSVRTYEGQIRRQVISAYKLVHRNSIKYKPFNKNATRILKIRCSIISRHQLYLFLPISIQIYKLITKVVSPGRRCEQYNKCIKSTGYFYKYEYLHIYETNLTKKKHTPNVFKLNTKGLGELPTVSWNVYCTAGEEIAVELASAKHLLDVLLSLKHT